MPHGSNTSYYADNYTRDVKHDLLPGGWLAQTSKRHPCHDPVNVSHADAACSAPAFCLTPFPMERSLWRTAAAPPS